MIAPDDKEKKIKGNLTRIPSIRDIQDGRFEEKGATRKREADFERWAESADRVANASRVLHRDLKTYHSFKSLAAALRSAQRGDLPAELRPYLERVKEDIEQWRAADDRKRKNAEPQITPTEIPEEVDAKHQEQGEIPVTAETILTPPKTADAFDNSALADFAGNLANYPVELPQQELPEKLELSLPRDESDDQKYLTPQEKTEGLDKNLPVDGKAFHEMIEDTDDASSQEFSPENILAQVEGFGDAISPSSMDNMDNQEEGGESLPSSTQIQPSIGTPEQSTGQPPEDQKEESKTGYLAKKGARQAAKSSIKKGIAAQQAAGNLGKLSERQMSKKLAKSGAVEGAVEGLLQGDIKKAIWLAACYYFLDIMFGIMIATSESIIGAVIALLYLDFHYFMSKMGSRIFCEMGFLQKVSLVVANFVVMILVVFAALVVKILWCYANQSVFTTIWEMFRGNFMKYCFK